MVYPTLEKEDTREAVTGLIVTWFLGTWHSAWPPSPSFALFFSKKKLIYSVMTYWAVGHPGSAWSLNWTGWAAPRVVFICRYEFDGLVGRWSWDDWKYFGKFSNLIIRGVVLEILLILPRQTTDRHTGNPSHRRSCSQVVGVLRHLKRCSRDGSKWGSMQVTTRFQYGGG